ncbi:MAG: hypothetical protein QNJ89_04700 [Acidimicrobiia bacterium]|nr:hypothetical protein [Acidimicrobiia bacterium]
MGELLLFIHVTAVAVWIGAGVTQLIVSPAMGRIGGASAAAWMRQTVRLGRVLFSPAAVLVLISGVWMVARERVYEYEQAFVVIGFVAVALGAFLGIRVYGPGGEEVAGLHESGEADRAAEKQQRLLTIGAAEIAFLLFTVWAMINRIGL